MCTRAYMSIQKYLQIHIRSADLDLAMGFAELAYSVSSVTTEPCTTALHPLKAGILASPSTITRPPIGSPGLSTDASSNKRMLDTPRLVEI